MIGPARIRFQLPGGADGGPASCSMMIGPARIRFRLPAGRPGFRRTAGRMASGFPGFRFPQNCFLFISCSMMIGPAWIRFRLPAGRPGKHFKNHFFQHGGRPSWQIFFGRGFILYLLLPDTKLIYAASGPVSGGAATGAASWPRLRFRKNIFLQGVDKVEPRRYNSDIITG